MNQKCYKTLVDYYVWHGESECDNKTDDLREALHIRTDLIADGHRSVRIVDSHEDEVDGDYVARLFVNVRLVSETVSDPEDEGAAGLYQVVFGDAVLQEQNLCREELAEIALSVFHAHQGIEDLSDFEIEVVDAFGRVVAPDTEYDGFGEDDGDVEKVGEPLTELRVSKESESMVTLQAASVVEVIRVANSPRNSGEGYLVCVTTAAHEFFRGAVQTSEAEIEESGTLSLVLWEPRRNGNGPTGLELCVSICSIAAIEIEW